MTFSVFNQFSKQKEKRRLFSKFIWVGAESGLGLGLSLGLVLELVSKVVLWGIFRNIPSHDAGTTREPHQLSRLLR